MQAHAPADPLGSLPQLGDGSELPSAEERRLGDRIARSLFADPAHLDDPVLVDYVQSIWQPLLRAARQRGELSPELDERFAWRVLLGRDRTVNAFALPGGYLGVNLGLLAVVQSPDELASVLAHELSHVTQRHISRLMTQQNAQSPWLLGAMILGALAASKNADAGNALMVGGQALAAQSQLNFSRDMEREADRIGLGVMTQAGFDAQGFVSMFGKLQQASRLNDNGNYPYLRTHPLTTERIADLHSRLPLAAMQPGAQITPGLRHAMMAARAAVLSQTDVDARRSWLARADDAGLPDQPASTQVGVLYAAALAASQAGDPQAAQRHLQGLQGLTAADPAAAEPVNWLALELALAAAQGAAASAGQPPDALKPPLAASQASHTATPRRPALLLQAEVALARQEPPALRAGAEALQNWLLRAPQDALVWHTLGRLQASLGQSLRSLRAEAEARAAVLDYPGALDRLSAAQDWIRHHPEPAGSAHDIEASIIDTRRRQIETLLKDQEPQRL